MRIRKGSNTTRTTTIPSPMKSYTSAEKTKASISVHNRKVETSGSEIYSSFAADSSKRIKLNHQMSEQNCIHEVIQREKTASKGGLGWRKRKGC